MRHRRDKIRLVSEGGMFASIARMFKEFTPELTSEKDVMLKYMLAIACVEARDCGAL